MMDLLRATVTDNAGNSVSTASHPGASGGNYKPTQQNVLFLPIGLMRVNGDKVGEVGILRKVPLERHTPTAQRERS